VLVFDMSIAEAKLTVVAFCHFTTVPTVLASVKLEACDPEQIT